MDDRTLERSTSAPVIRRTGTRVEKVFAAMLGWIADGHFPVDGRLPTEHELSHHFSVSRPVIRSAIAKLREKGLVRSVQGSGTIVIGRPNQAAVDAAEATQATVRDLQRCFEFRVLIETEAAYLAALRHDRRVLERIRETVYPSSSLTAPASPSSASFDFHQAVVEAADNPFLIRAMETIMAQPGFQFYLKLRGISRAPDLSEHVTKIRDEHGEILRLIERRQANDAKEYMRHHIQGAYDGMIQTISLVKSS